LRRIAVRFVGCESWRNALSQTSSGDVAGADLPFVLRNARSERGDVSRQLRLAVSRDFQLAFAARQPPPLLGISLWSLACGFVDATARRIFTAAFRNNLATRRAREQRSFCGRNCCTDLCMSCGAAACARCSWNPAVARTFCPLLRRNHGNWNVVRLVVRMERLQARPVLDLVFHDARAAGWTFL
jgi:hypothetical protein